MQVPNEILLSVLVPGIPERLLKDGESSAGMLYELSWKAEGRPVEIVYLMDNRKMSVGRKRNILLSIVQGRYFAFVDDDDRVADDYVDRLLETIGKMDADVIVFDQLCTHVKTGVREFCRYGLGMEYTRTPRATPNEYDWTGLPAHTMAWRTETVNMVEFPDGNFAEDTSWVKQACTRAKTEYRIDGWTGYYYNFDSESSATR
jgi:glycosyltransferase involved in cell wall biosynthesis